MGDNRRGVRVPLELHAIAARPLEVILYMLHPYLGTSCCIDLPSLLDTWAIYSYDPLCSMRSSGIARVGWLKSACLSIRC
jgi:hypothetical protein